MAPSTSNFTSNARSNKLTYLADVEHGSGLDAGALLSQENLRMGYRPTDAQSGEVVSNQAARALSFVPRSA
jgi:hypothetical protein